MYQLYGIPNCDTVKKAKKHLESIDVEFEFINFKTTSPNKKLLMKWKKKLGELPVNTRGRTYRELKEKYEAGNEEEKINLITQNSSLIKRPLLEKDSKPVLMGYKKEDYDEVL